MQVLHAEDYDFPDDLIGHGVKLWYEISLASLQHDQQLQLQQRLRFQAS